MSKYRGWSKVQVKACPKCGAVVISLKQHKRWHKKNKPVPGPPGPMGMMGPAGGSTTDTQYRWTEDDAGNRLTPRVPVTKKQLRKEQGKWRKK